MERLRTVRSALKMAMRWRGNGAKMRVIAGVLIVTGFGVEAVAQERARTFSRDSHCTRALNAIPATPRSNGGFASWAQACAARSNNERQSLDKIVNALRNAAKLHLSDASLETPSGDRMAILNAAAQRGTAANELLDTRPNTQSSQERRYGARYKFDGLFIAAAPRLALGLTEGDGNRVCGTADACLSSGLALLEATEIDIVQPRLSDDNRYYQSAAAHLQILNAKAHAKLAETGDSGNIDRSLSILKTVVAMAPESGNASLPGKASNALIEIATTSADRAVDNDRDYDAAIRYLTEAAQIAAAGDAKQGLYFNIGVYNERKADALLDSENGANAAAAATSFCDGAKAFRLADGHSEALKTLEAKEGYAYALSKLEEQGSTACDASQANALAAFAASEALRATYNETGHQKYLEAYGALLNRAGRFQDSVDAFTEAETAKRGLPSADEPDTEEPTPADDVRFNGGNARANSLLVLAVRNSRIDQQDNQETAKAQFVQAENADAVWPTAYLEHAKFLARSGDIDTANRKLYVAIGRAIGKADYSAELAEAYYERSRNHLSKEIGTEALADGANAVLTNSANPAFKQQACLAALFAEKGERTDASVSAYCPSASTGSAEDALSTEDLLLNAFRKHRQAQLVRRAGNLTGKIGAFDNAAESYRKISVREDKSDIAGWPLPQGDVSFGDVAQIGGWAADACGTLGGGAPMPVIANRDRIVQLFDAYGLQLCDVR
ncbi:MAG: hypothetical protein NXH78_07110 [Hyphomonadaceae bacterium]|nr:hypothetical protein [Hyphomonadaceae bacterium]